MRRCIQNNYSRIKDVERELSGLQMQLKLSTGPKKSALMMLRKKIEVQNDRVLAARAAQKAAKKASPQDLYICILLCIPCAGVAWVQACPYAHSHVCVSIRAKLCRHTSPAAHMIIEASVALRCPVALAEVGMCNTAHALPSPSAHMCAGV